MDTLDGWMIRKDKKRRGIVWPYVASIVINGIVLLETHIYRDVPIWISMYAALVIGWSVLKLIQGLKRR